MYKKSYSGREGKREGGERGCNKSKEDCKREVEVVGRGREKRGIEREQGMEVESLKLIGEEGL